METLIGVLPQDILLHGPTKLYVDKYHWHQPDHGIVASYTAKARDVQDHFGLFRGVDQIEAFAQATVGSCCPFLECRKHKFGPEELRNRFIPAFISVGRVLFHNYIAEGETFMSIGKIIFYKFRQMVCEGRIYKVPAALDLDSYFSEFTREQMENYDLSKDFTLVAELWDITGRAIKKEAF
ncbi:hypothetical protein [Daejeonella sp.]|uniref:hypothetical protein n=1 Tax=Daejeonella sp. TaxID=2805397 RepID=UPI0030BD03FB